MLIGLVNKLLTIVECCGMYEKSMLKIVSNYSLLGMVLF